MDALWARQFVANKRDERTHRRDYGGNDTRWTVRAVTHSHTYLVALAVVIKYNGSLAIGADYLSREPLSFA